jgi:hypothetical protein
MPHELSAELKAKRVEIYKEMPEILEELDPRQKNHVITGDEFWIYRDNYHLVDKYMHQPRLMKLNIANIDKNYLSSDVVSIDLPWLTS